ncbi:solute carrier family 35 member G1-like [Parasteatoda tepidariorum]|uniref:solute carrier family 35 member G1-like n=1 Tax=Parasteatoda tepidariorum TaxID=114398 RepID=UPI00077FD9D8|nr:solute carrier family 35 member G1-like [Parasteatoda tepidariorum]
MIWWNSKSFALPSLEQKIRALVTTEKNNSEVFKGLLLATISGLLYSCTTVVVKYVDNLDPGQLCLYRHIAIFTLNIPEVIKCRQGIFLPNNFRVLLIIRSICSATHILVSYYAFRLLPLAEANVILFSIPAFVTVAARIFLKEPCGIFQSISLVFTVIGLIFTAKIPSYFSGSPIVHSKEYIQGLIFAFSGILLNTAQIILLRKTKEVHRATVVSNLGIIAIIELASVTAIFGDFKWNMCGWQNLYIIILGIFSYLSQALMTRAFQCEFAGPVSTVRAGADIGLSFIWQTAVFKMIPDTFSIIGALLVMVSIILVGIRNWVSSLPNDSPKLKHLKWILK